MSKLLQDAIADAKMVKEIAYENAKAAIAEAFQPKIQRMISTKLAEEEFDEDEFNLEPKLDLEVDPVVTADDEYVEETYTNDGKNGTPDNPIKDDGSNPQLGLDEMDDDELDEEFDKIIKELEGNAYEDDSMEDESFEDAVIETGRSVSDVANSNDTDDELDDLNLEALIKKLEEEEDEYTEDEPVSNPLKMENARLKAENKEVFKVIAELKRTMNEVNLLNSKLMYSSKVIQSFDLSESQQVKILETFDRANTVREVKLIYATIQENYRGKNTSSKSRRVIPEGASKTIRTVKSTKPSRSNDLMEGAERWKIIAGLQPIND